MTRSVFHGKFCVEFSCPLCFSEKFFDMNKKNARDALDIYKRFLIRMDRVGEFLKVAEVKNPQTIFPYIKI